MVLPCENRIRNTAVSSRWGWVYIAIEKQDHSDSPGPLDAHRLRPHREGAEELPLHAARGGLVHGRPRRVAPSGVDNLEVRQYLSNHESEPHGGLIICNMIQAQRSRQMTQKGRCFMVRETATIHRRIQKRPNGECQMI